MKKVLKWVLYSLGSILYGGGRTVINKEITIKKISVNGRPSFFGYYDKYPERNGRVLFHSIRDNDSEKLDIAIKDIETDKSLRILGNTCSFNWQQGSRLMWLNDNEVIFNDYIEGKPSCIRVSLDGEITRYPFSIHDCYLDKFSLTLNYARLTRYSPDYGYEVARFELLDDMNDGIWYNSLIDNKSKLLVSLSQCKSIIRGDDQSHLSHWINHIMISPEGDKCIFIYRFKKYGKRRDSLMLLNLNNNELSVLKNDSFVSHMSWENNENLIGYLTGPCGKAYYRICIYNNHWDLVLNNNRGDGHPTVVDNLLITDTYPGLNRTKELYIYNINNRRTRNVALFEESMRFWGPTRCDLHPKIKNNPREIYIESVHEGLRNLYKIYDE